MISVTTLLVSIVLHHFYEKVYLKMERPVVISLIVLLILSNAFLQYSIRTHNFWKTRLSPSLQKIVDDNRANVRDGNFWNPEIYFEEPCFEVFEPYSPAKRSDSFGNCKFRVGALLHLKHEIICFQKGNGSLSVMLVGNSYSMNILDSIRLQFNHNYSNFHYLGLARISSFTVSN